MKCTGRPFPADGYPHPERSHADRPATDAMFNARTAVWLPLSSPPSSSGLTVRSIRHCDARVPQHGAPASFGTFHGGMPHRSAQPDGVDRARPEWFAAQSDGVDRARPEWFAAFLADRGTRKPSAHTLKAYRQDFDAIATLIAGGEDLSGMPLSAIMIEAIRTAFAQYAEPMRRPRFSGAGQPGTCYVPTSIPLS